MMKRQKSASESNLPSQTVDSHARPNEYELQESAERLDILINAMPDLVIFKDGHGRYLEANELALRLFGLEGVDYQGKTDCELVKFSPFHRQEFIDCLETEEAAWQAKSISRSDEIKQRPDGSARIFDVIKVPTFFPDGQRKRLVVVGRDVTERRQAEVALQQAHDELERRVEERTEELSRAKTFAHIESLAGAHFDPKVVRLFLQGVLFDFQNWFWSKFMLDIREKFCYTQ